MAGDVVSSEIEFLQLLQIENNAKKDTKNSR